MKFASTIEPSAAETIVINTGARPTRPSIDGLDDRRRSRQAADLLGVPRFPPHWPVIGGGYVGCEYAQMYSRFRADVTVFQRGDTLLQMKDPDVSEIIETAFENEEITRQTGTPVTALTGPTTASVSTPVPTAPSPITTSDVALAARPEHRIWTASSSEDIGASLDENGFVGPTTASERLLAVSTPLAT